MIDWRRNLTHIWWAQFISSMSFFFAMPFVPFYFQDMGVSDPDELKLWVSLFAAAAPLSLAILQPVWGWVADHRGRRLMMLRAFFGATIVLSLMGLCRSPYQVIALRLLQGFFTGTVPAGQALVSANTPPDRLGVAMGAFNAAIFSGTTAGFALGGILAEVFGVRGTFFLAAGMMLLGGLQVVYGIKEEFTPPPPRPRAIARKLHLPALGAAWFIFPLTAMVAFDRQFDNALFPLLVQGLHGSLAGAAFFTGCLAATGSAAGFLAGFVMGWLTDHQPPLRIARVCAILGAFFMLGHTLAAELWQLFPLRFGLMFSVAGMDILIQVWLARIATPRNQGAVFGWNASARFVGWIFAPLTSGFIATQWGSIQSIYYFGSVSYLLFIPLLMVILPHLSRPGAQPGTPA